MGKFSGIALLHSELHFYYKFSAVFLVHNEWKESLEHNIDMGAVSLKKGFW